MQVVQLSDLFDPQEELANDACLAYNGVMNGKRCGRWQKIWNKMKHGETYTTSTATVRKRQDGTYNKEWQGQARIPERRFQNITEYSGNIPEHSGIFRQILRNIPEPCTHNSGGCDRSGKVVPI